MNQYHSNNGPQQPPPPPPPPPPPVPYHTSPFVTNNDAFYNQSFQGGYSCNTNNNTNSNIMPTHNYTVPPPPPLMLYGIPPPPPPPMFTASAKHQYDSFSPKKKQKRQHDSKTNNRSSKNDESFPCTICIKGNNNNSTTSTYTFSSKNALETHIKSHVKCKKCDFVACPKLLTLHLQTQHSGKYAGRGLKAVRVDIPGTNFSKKFHICVGNHPEDIQKWIQQRKLRYPTLKKRLEQQRENNFQNEKEEKKDSNFLKSTKSNDNDDNIIMTEKTHQTSSPISHNDANQIAAEKWRQENSALSSLMANYDSSSDDDGAETTKEMEQNKQLEINNGQKLNLENRNDNNNLNESMVKSHLQHNQNEECSNYIHSQNDKYRTKPCRFFLRNGTCKNGDNCLYIHDNASHKQYLTDAVKRREQQSRRDKSRHVANQELNVLTNGNTKHSSHSSYNPSSSTLLKKLLAKDMERERSLTLQLLRYIVDCNYLQKQKQPRIAEKQDEHS